MANQEHLEILAKGVQKWNRWRSETTVKPNFVHVDLSEAYLMWADLRGMDLHGVDLTGVNLTRADLRGVNLRDVSLLWANLSQANLSQANLSDSDLTGANLSRADLGDSALRRVNLDGANLNDANLNSADLTRANLTMSSLRGASLNRVLLGETVLGDVDFDGAIGLETVIHAGPSTIGISTIYRSKGKIPEVFLRGAGVPENFITYMKSLTGSALEFYSVFISYSTKDQVFADRLHADLQSKGVRCWFAPHDIQGGRKIHEQIDEAIRVYDKLLLILSEHSMNSNWVKTEIANARAKEEQQKRQMLFPISLVPFDQVRSWKLFDADAGIDSAREIREYFIPDFSGWKDHDSYAKAFDRLVRDLKAGEMTVDMPSHF